MNIVTLLGSPRTGNSAAIAERFSVAGEGLGATSRTFRLNSLEYRGCQACGACKTTSDRCIVQDDLAPVLEAVREADVVVLATPVYFGEITGQLKTFFDRTFSFFTPDYRTAANPSRLAPGKKLVFIQTQGQPDGSFFDDLYPRYDRFFKRIGFTETFLIRGVGLSAPDDALKQQGLLESAEQLASKIVSKPETAW